MSSEQYLDLGLIDDSNWKLFFLFLFFFILADDDKFRSRIHSRNYYDTFDRRSIDFN